MNKYKIIHFGNTKTETQRKKLLTKTINQTNNIESNFNYMILVLSMFNISPEDIEVKLSGKKVSILELQKCISSLPLSEQEILNLRYSLSGGKLLTLKEVAEIKHCSHENIRQIELRAIRKLKHRIRKKKYFLDDI